MLGDCYKAIKVVAHSCLQQVAEDPFDLDVLLKVRCRMVADRSRDENRSLLFKGKNNHLV